MPTKVDVIYFYVNKAVQSYDSNKIFKQIANKFLLKFL